MSAPTDAVVLPDAMLAVRDWVRSLDLDAHYVGRCHRGYAADGGHNQIVLRRIGGVSDDYVDIDNARISFEVWGATPDLASLAARQLEAAIKSVQCGTQMGTDAEAKGAQVTLGPSWRPDGEAGRPRFLLDAVFTLVPLAEPA